MPELFRELLQRLEQTQVLLIAALIIARTMPMVFLTPFLGGKLIPAEVKMGLGVMLTVILFPFADGALHGLIPIEPAPFLGLMLKEAFIGFVIGFINAHIFFALEIAGRFIDTVRGTSMSEVHDPHSQTRATPIGDMYIQLFLVIFMVSGGHRVFLTGYFYSFEAFPLDRMLGWGDPSFASFMEHMMKLTAEMLSIAVVLAAPVVAATFITDVVFGILNRVAPQLNAYFMSMPVKALGGVIIIFIALEAIVGRMDDFVVWVLLAVNRSLALLSV